VTPEAAFKQLTESIDTYDQSIGLTKDQLYHLGLQPWGKEEVDGVETDKELWLFPLSFYDHIPAGFPIVFIDWEKGFFMPKVTDNDTRFGYLAFGILGTLKQ
jgi:hypothetical protein